LTRGIRYLFGKATSYEAVLPWLWLLVEYNNVRGKIDALIETRGMKDPIPAMRADPRRNIHRFYGSPSSRRYSR
jgi:hypothetical protein